jgi:hypothetical protein
VRTGKSPSHSPITEIKQVEVWKCEVNVISVHLDGKHLMDRVVHDLLCPFHHLCTSTMTQHDSAIALGICSIVMRA